MELFHFDIETASQYSDFQSFTLNDERGSKLFEYKFNKMWSDKYPDIDSAYLDNAGIISTYGKIVCVSCGYLDNDGNKKISSIYGDDEKDIVIKFNDYLKKIEKKNFNLCGFRIINFDIPWLLHKLHKYGVEPANMIYLYDKKPWDLRVVDMSDDWKSRFAWSYNFDEVAYELGINSPKEKIDGSKVNEYYWSGRLEEIKNYCEKDVEASIEISKIIYKK